MTNDLSLEKLNKHNFFLSEEIKANLQKLAENLQVIKDHFEKPIKITSGYRTPEYNATVSKATKSYHTKGMAADFKIDGVSPKVIADQIKMLMNAGKIEKGGLKAYDTFVHYDIRGNYKTW